MWVDSHCHLDDERLRGELDAVIGRARDAGVEKMMTIGTGDGPPDLEAALRIAAKYDCVWATIGVHPHDAAKADDSTLGSLESLLAEQKVLALGEIGLDYHYDFSPRDRQRALFGEQIALANRAGVPIVIHTREAWEDTFAILETYWNPAPGGIMHCFSGGPDEARKALALGFHLSFSGVVTYPKAENVREAARLTPLDRMLVETDAPYLAPVPHRGKRNEPAFTALTGEHLAGTLGIPVADLAAATSRNWGELCRPGAVLRK